MGAAEDLFERIDREWLEAARRDQTEHESLHLEFKTVRDAERPFESRDDRNNLATCLSGFANADGGVVVWGVSSTTEDGFNVITDLPGVSVFRTRSRIEELLPDVVSPQVVGLRVAGIERDGQPGFVKVLVPAGEGEPHMAGGTEHRYYRRAGANHLKMEHFEVASLFGRKTKPVLQPWHRIELGLSGIHKVFRITVGLRNAGLGIARFPLFQIDLDSMKKMETTFYEGVGKSSLREVRGEPGWRTYVGGADDVIHPTLIFPTQLLAIDQRSCQNRTDSIYIAARVAAEGMPITNIKYVITPDEFRAASESKSGQ